MEKGGKFIKDTYNKKIKLISKNKNYTKNKTDDRNTAKKNKIIIFLKFGGHLFFFSKKIFKNFKIFLYNSGL